MGSRIGSLAQQGKTRRQVIVYTDENGEWCAACPRLPGCHSQSDTQEEALDNIKEAIRAYLEALEQDHLSSDRPAPAN